MLLVPSRLCLSSLIYIFDWKSTQIYHCFSFGCRRQQKRHAAAPPPAGVRRRMKRNRQKPVGRDKGRLTEQQTKGNRNNNGTNKEKTQQWTVRPRQPLSRTAPAPLPPRPQVSSRRAGSPHRNPAWCHMVWNTGLCLARWGQPPPGCVPSWSPVKINPVLAKPRTLSTPYSIPSTSCPGPPLSSWSPPLLLFPDIIPLVYGS